ncbi:MAG TPA: gfo/Idh/MocA family oxidoreductase [Clostridiales bacterium]|nr:gfo/Idh/MocA family oxidoreductase [Clostridiales bacterium]
MADILRYACIGAGKIALKKHLGVYAGIPGVEMAAVCDASREVAQTAADRFGIPGVYTDLEEMLKKEQIDFASVCTPNCLHVPMSMALVERGIHVHCEKPVGMSAVEVEALKQAVDRKGVTFMAGLNFRFSREAEQIQSYLRKGRLGDIYHAKCGWMRRNGIPGSGVWFTVKDLSGGGPLIDLGVHYLDLLMMYLEYPEVASVKAHTYKKFAGATSRIREGYPDRGEGVFDVEDMAVGLISMKNGASVCFEFSWASNVEAEHRYITLLGTRGGIDCRNGVVKYIGEKAGRPADEISPSEPVAVGKPDTAEHLHFLECLRAGQQPRASLEQALKLMHIIDAAYASAGEAK